eukprot:TRINITY_DN2633_c0_g1_i1.p1 TRINITY_DN2633_c0_g1~~TRINITY_DN2633_c0_g1_i1.p1  ORF type:complete len:371 (-),score=87.99 TRINITY_DN2633_c0_g1_i1:1466-2578(-)
MATTAIDGMFRTRTPRKKKQSDVQSPIPVVEAAPSVTLDENLPVVELSAEQQYCIQLVLAGFNLFLTGCAGSGKSFLLHHLVKILPADSTFVTALTGVAAVQLGGVTLHSFAGIQLGNKPLDVMIAMAKSSKQARSNWERCRTLIIDEVSMLDAELFDNLDVIARAVRGNDVPFGGIQLVLCGDFFQLPPVSKAGQQSKGFAFQSAIWARCIHYSIELQHVFRQSDAAFLQLLQDVRYSRPSARTIAQLHMLQRPLDCPDGIQPTRLYATNKDVDTMNLRYLEQLPDDAVEYKAQDTGSERALGSGRLLAVASLTLKLGAQVMLLRNMNDGSQLVNGSRGVVVAFLRGLPVVRFVNGKERSFEVYTNCYL